MALRSSCIVALRALGTAPAAASEPAAAVTASASAAARAGAAWRRPHQPPQTQVCSCSYSTTTAPNDETERRKLASKLLYRSKQRGFLELDLLVGLWAEGALPRMGLEQLQQFSRVLDEENPDLFKWLTGQLPTPSHLAANEQYMALKAHIDRQLSENRAAAAMTAAGRDWVRGWDDPNRAPATGGGQAAAAGTDRS